MKLLCPLEDRFDNWLKSPAPNAAGRMGLYRILFGLYYLWIIRGNFFQELAFIPDGDWSSDTSPLQIVEFINGLANRPGPLFFQVAEITLVASLIVLIIGFRVRIATLLVLLSGIFLFAFANTFGKVSHGNALYAAYIPAIMLFSSWGSNYSIDALLERRRRGTSVDPQDDSWRYIWPMRAALILLAILFFASGYMKLVGESWITNPELIHNLLLRRNISASTSGQVDIFNHVNLWIAQSGWIATLLQHIALLFEFTFPLALVNRKLTALYLSTAILFHAFNGLFLEVGFVQILIFYAIFIDWQQLYQAVPVKRTVSLESIPSWLIQAGSLAIAITLGIVWSVAPIARIPFRILRADWIWYVVGVLGLIWWIKNALRLIKSVLPGSRTAVSHASVS